MDELDFNNDIGGGSFTDSFGGSASASSPGPCGSSVPLKCAQVSPEVADYLAKGGVITVIPPTPVAGFDED